MQAPNSSQGQEVFRVVGSEENPKDTAVRRVIDDSAKRHVRPTSAARSSHDQLASVAKQKKLADCSASLASIDWCQRLAFT